MVVTGFVDLRDETRHGLWFDGYSKVLFGRIKAHNKRTMVSEHGLISLEFELELRELRLNVSKK